MNNEEKEVTNAIYELMKGKDYLDKNDQLVWYTREMKGHGSTCRRDIKTKSFPQRNKDIWSGVKMWSKQSE